MTVKFTFGKCKTKATYSAKLLQKNKLDLNKIKNKYELVMETPILLVIKINNIEIIVHQHGELLFKNCEDVKWMESIVEEIYVNYLIK